MLPALLRVIFSTVVSAMQSVRSVASQPVAWNLREARCGLLVQRCGIGCFDWLNCKLRTSTIGLELKEKLRINLTSFTEDLIIIKNEFIS